MRFSWGLLAAGLVVAAARPAAAGPFYVQANANATTSGIGVNGNSASLNTGQIQAPSAVAGPFVVSSSGQLYDFEATSGAVTEVGAIHAHATASASSSGPAGGASAGARGQWSDTITITSDTLAPGTLVQFLATVVLHRTITGGGLGTHASADVTGPFGLNLIDALDAPNPAESVSTVVTTTVGSVMTATGTLSLEADAGGIAPFSLSASVIADNTAVFEFVPITVGASYVTASGATFPAVSEAPAPGGLALAVAGGLSALPIALRRRRPGAFLVQT
jgi:hypothetical protein